MNRAITFLLIVTWLVSTSVYAQEASNTPPPPKRVRISQMALEKYIVEKSLPEYPEAARKKKVQGLVRLHVILTTSGEIQSLDVIDGDPLLAQAALDGVRRWKFKPYLLNSEPAEVDSQITVEFKLSKNTKTT
jgi:periplasmic protein TonB